jgi:hypothetical protein
LLVIVALRERSPGAYSHAGNAGCIEETRDRERRQSLCAPYCFDL